MAAKISSTTVTIPNGTALSAAVQLDGRVPYLVVLPAAWTAANVTFQVSADGGATYGGLFAGDAGSEAEYKLTTTYTAASGAIVRAIPVDGNKFSGATFLKVQSGVTGTTVNQGADRIVTLGLRDL